MMEKIEDFSSLEGLPLEKLIKLRDVAGDEFYRLRKEVLAAECRYMDLVLMVIDAREGK